MLNEGGAFLWSMIAKQYRGGEIRLAGSSASQLDLNVFCVQYQTLSRPSSVISDSCQRIKIYWGTTVDDRTDRSTVAFAVGCDSEESAKGRHLGEGGRERERGGGGNEEREGDETVLVLIRTFSSDPAYIRRENRVVDHTLGENSS